MRSIKERRLPGGGQAKAIPVRRLIPNFITLLGLCAGLTAIRMAVEGRFDVAIGAIILAALLDGVDGRMARLLKANSQFGAELDSLADFVNFGVAPALTLYLWGLTSIPSLGWIAVVIFAVAAALRLARFNVAASQEAETRPAWQRGFFTGVPTPAGAILLLFPLYLEGLGIPKLSYAAPLLALYAFGVAGLMISHVPTFSGKFEQTRIDRSQVPIAIVAVAFLAGMLATYPYLTLALASLAYAASLPASLKAYRQLKEEDSLDATPPKPAVRLSVVETPKKDGTGPQPPKS